MRFQPTRNIRILVCGFGCITRVEYFTQNCLISETSTDSSTGESFERRISVFEFQAITETISQIYELNTFLTATYAEYIKRFSTAIEKVVGVKGFKLTRASTLNNFSTYEISLPRNMGKYDFWKQLAKEISEISKTQ
ncbi:MAG: hypothetical protein NTW79_02330 [Candidatus Berkelbacteria bacterium]|nr:hypothetical protein [Candidatus Berkelbacteria bacterium]